MNRIRLRISYDGTDFFGWQKQTHEPTVQGSVEAALSQIFGEPIKTIAASRTDAGVHALWQEVHFNLSKPAPSFDLVKAINGLTPKAISVKDAWLAPTEFHANRSPITKTYRYKILNTNRPSALLNRYSWWIRRPLNIEYLNETSKFLVGEHDFKSFQSQGTELRTSVRRVTEARWTQKGQVVEFSITGTGFLKQMVRNIVGTLIDLERRGLPGTTLKDIMEKCDRRFAKTTAPAEGLFLYRICYPKELDKKCRKL